MNNYQTKLDFSCSITKTANICNLCKQNGVRETEKMNELLKLLGRLKSVRVTVYGWHGRRFFSLCNIMKFSFWSQSLNKRHSSRCRCHRWDLYCHQKHKRMHDTKYTTPKCRLIIYLNRNMESINCHTLLFGAVLFRVSGTHISVAWFTAECSLTRMCSNCVCLCVYATVWLWNKHVSMIWCLHIQF